MFRTLVLLLSILGGCSTLWAWQQEGDSVAAEELLRDLPPNAEHPLPRKVVKHEEETITSQPQPKRLLVVHYRAPGTAQYSMNDDRIVVAVKNHEKYKILEVRESDTVVVDGAPYSDNDFDERFITTGGKRFLEVTDNFSGSGASHLHDVYSISSDDRLTVIPFEDAGKSSLLRTGEELRKAQIDFRDGIFVFYAGIYKADDGECCPSQGTFHAQFTLEGGFKQDASTHVFAPELKFVIAKQWRDKD